MAKVKICLDAGHYGKYNQSPAVKNYYEAEMNWKLHNLLKKYLEEYGIEVIQTRSKQAVDMGLKARGVASKGCNLFVSIHSNAVGNGVNESVDYPLVCVPINGSGTKIGEKLAKCIESVMGTKQKGKILAKKGSGNWDYYSVIYGATSVGVPGIILEHSFHTNTKMAKWLLDEKNLDKLAKAEAEVIANHYGLKKETPKVETNAAVKVGDKVKIKTGSVYGGLSSTRGKEVPKSVLSKSYEVTKVETHKGVSEALLKEINSWVAVSSLTVTTASTKKTTTTTTTKKTVAQIAEEVMNGKWGNGEERKKRLTEAGYNYSEVQKEVNRLYKG